VISVSVIVVLIVRFECTGKIKYIKTERKSKTKHLHYLPMHVNDKGALPSLGALRTMMEHKKALRSIKEH
jgi:hypothetical protein